jgi:PAS domain S-box-containing protein
VEFKDGTLLDRYSAPIVAKDGICFGRIWVFRDITAQRRAETTLRESEAKFRELAENINDVFWISVPDMSKMIYISPAYEAIWGRLPGSLYKNPQEWHEAIHPEDRARVWACIQKLSVEVPSISIEFRVVRPDGTVRWIHDRGFLVRDASGKVVHTAGVAKDITERKRTEEALRVSLAEKTTLLQEVHHRVKNNLQIVSSLLNLQAGHVQDAAVLELLAVTRSRVGAMALLHENLYQSENLARLNLPEYVESLCAQLLRAAGPIHARIRLERHIEPETVSLGLDQAVPCGLLLNELVTNALKHAFPGERSGCIRVTLERATPQTARLTVADDGVGLPVTLDPSHTSSLGLQLVFLLTQQLHGTVNFERGQGTAVHILFPNSAEKETPHE